MPEPPKAPARFTFGLGPLYGHNFGETDNDSGGKTENDLAGVELSSGHFRLRAGCP